MANLLLYDHADYLPGSGAMRAPMKLFRLFSMASHHLCHALPALQGDYADGAYNLAQDLALLAHGAETRIRGQGTETVMTLQPYPSRNQAWAGGS
jgi:hypothetical protein